MSERLEVKVPFENVNDPTAKVLSWRVSSGATVKAGDVLAELENSKTTFEVSAPSAGVVEYGETEAIGAEIAVGDRLCWLTVAGDGPASPNSAPAVAPVAPSVAVTFEGNAAPPTKVEPQPVAVAPASPASVPVPAPAMPSNTGVGGRSGSAVNAPIFSSKAVEALRELGLEKALFGGMVMVREADVRRMAAPPVAVAAVPAVAPLRAAAPAPKSAVASQPKPSAEDAEEVPLERAKLFENRELGAANGATLRSTLYYLCPAPGFREACARQSPPVNRLAVVLFETARLLAKHRYLNAWQLDQSAFLYKHVHLGFAVDVDRGLKVLVVRDADKLSYAGIAAKVEELLVKYATDSLATEDISGSTFTVTDLGQEGVFTFEPLINNRQAGILAIGAEQPGIQGFMLACAFDHRVTTGKVVAEFLRDLSARLAGHCESIRPRDPSPPSCSRCLATLDELRAGQAFLIPSVEPEGFICSTCLAGY